MNDTQFILNNAISTSLLHLDLRSLPNTNRKSNILLRWLEMPTFISDTYWLQHADNHRTHYMKTWQHPWKRTHTCTLTCLTTLYPKLPGWTGTREIKSIYILLKQETVSGSDISWITNKSALHPRQLITPTTHSHYSVFLQAWFPSCRPTASNHWQHMEIHNVS